MKYVWLSSALFENENIKENAEVLIKFLASVNALIINPMSIELSIEARAINKFSSLFLR